VRDADHLPAPIFEVKNTWSFTITSIHLWGKKVKKEKVKQAHYRPGHAVRVRGG
jgi:hypothetical protein